MLQYELVDQQPLEFWPKLLWNFCHSPQELSKQTVRTCNVSRADTKKTRSSASFTVFTLSSFTKKSTQRS